MRALEAPLVPKPLRVVVGFVALGIAVLSLGGVLSKEDPAAERPRGAVSVEGRTSSSEQASGGSVYELPYGEGPFGFRGHKIPLPAAQAIIAVCECPQLAQTGPMSPDHVVEAWTTPDGDIALIYDHDVILTYTPDLRNEQEFIADDEAAIADGFHFRHIDLRGTKASAADSDQQGPASLAWIEGPYLLELYPWVGEGTLADLIVLAESLLPPPSQT